MAGFGSGTIGEQNPAQLEILRTVQTSNVDMARADPQFWPLGLDVACWLTHWLRTDPSLSGTPTGSGRVRYKSVCQIFSLGASGTTATGNAQLDLGGGRRVVVVDQRAQAVVAASYTSQNLDLITYQQQDLQNLMEVGRAFTTATTISNDYQSTVGLEFGSASWPRRFMTPLNWEGTNKRNITVVNQTNAAVVLTLAWGVYVLDTGA